MTTYRIKNLIQHFEDGESREREWCSFFCPPTKRCGPGYGMRKNREALAPFATTRCAWKSALTMRNGSEINIKRIFKSLWFRWLAGGRGRKEMEVAPAQDFVGEAAEPPSVEEAIEMVMSAGIPDWFVRNVYRDWASRYGKDVGGASIRIVPYVTKRWVWESMKFLGGVALVRRRFANDIEALKKLQHKAALCALKKHPETNGKGARNEPIKSP